MYVCVCKGVGRSFRLEIKGSEYVQIMTCTSLPTSIHFVFSWYELTDHRGYMTVTATRETASSYHCAGKYIQYIRQI